MFTQKKKKKKSKKEESYFLQKEPAWEHKTHSGSDLTRCNQSIWKPFKKGMSSDLCVCVRACVRACVCACVCLLIWTRSCIKFIL